MRRLRESGNQPWNVDPARPFIWEDFAAGAFDGIDRGGARGLSSLDNFVFDASGNVWVVTDISSAR